MGWAIHTLPAGSAANISFPRLPGNEAVHCQHDQRFISMFDLNTLERVHSLSEVPKCMIKQGWNPSRYVRTSAETIRSDKATSSIKMVLPFLAIRTSPGLRAIPLGMFSYKASIAASRDDQSVTRKLNSDFSTTMARSKRWLESDSYAFGGVIGPS